MQFRMRLGLYASSTSRRIQAEGHFNLERFGEVELCASPRVGYLAKVRYTWPRFIRAIQSPFKPGEHNMGLPLSQSGFSAVAKSTETENNQGLLQLQIQGLQAKIARLQEDIQDLQIALTTTSEHGDLIEAELYQTNLNLSAEVKQRQRAEATLQSLLELICRERDDLEIIIETIMEHGDIVDLQWHQKLYEETLRAMSDGLTQVPNRRHFDDHFSHQWKLMRREASSLSIILCDIDYFKQYNDIYGHLAGDDCLRLVAQALNKQICRPGDLLARYGGEEFVVVLPNTTTESALAIAHMLQRTIADLKIPHAYSDISPYITLSMGVATTIPSPGQSANDLLRRADQRLYLAKQEGRNRIVYPSSTFLRESM